MVGLETYGLNVILIHTLRDLMVTIIPDFNGRPGDSLAECHTLTFPRDYRDPLVHRADPVYIFQTGVTACICHVRVVRRHVLM